MLILVKTRLKRSWSKVIFLFCFVDTSSPLSASSMGSRNSPLNSQGNCFLTERPLDDSFTDKIKHHSLSSQVSFG